MEIMITRVGRSSARTKLSKHAAMQLRVVLRANGMFPALYSSTQAAAILDRKCIGIYDSDSELTEVFYRP